tara:strand:+ start:211 stop:687 length:477 start_codon:yes stop_codon:yes gene_type:complete
LKRYERKGITKPTLNKVDKRYYEREEAREMASLRSTCRLKDTSFEHEKEVRVIVRLGETKLVDALLEDKELANPSHKYHKQLFGKNLDLLEYISRNELPLREFVQTDSMIINSVAIDPRSPPHKDKFMREWFQERSIPQVKSKCFGYVTDNFTVFPDR